MREGTSACGRMFFFDWYVLNVFVKPVLISKRFHTSLEDYDGASNVLRAWKIEGCVLRKQRVFSSQKFEA